MNSTNPVASGIPSGLRSGLGLIVWVAITFCAPAFGVLGMPGEWYASLNKPSWNPPSWIFGPVWSLLYLLMAVAAWRVWMHGGWRGQKGALRLYLIQLVLNALWTPLFFGLRQPGWAFVEILMLLAAVIATMLAFFKVSRLAGSLLVPYALWVAFASCLNGTLWWMNR